MKLKPVYINGEWVVNMTSEQKRQSLQKPGKRKKGTKSSGKPMTALDRKKANVGSKYWRDKADKIWSQLVKRDERCAVCGRMDIKRDSHHLLSRGKVMTRHDLENGMLLCVTHHLYSPDCSPHAGPIGFVEWLEENHPEKLEWVRQNRNRTGKPDYKANYERLKRELDKSF